VSPTHAVPRTLSFILIFAFVLHIYLRFLSVVIPYSFALNTVTWKFGVNQHSRDGGQLQ
jgi:hypothetical protein